MVVDLNDEDFNSFLRNYFHSKDMFETVVAAKVYGKLPLLFGT